MSSKRAGFRLFGLVGACAAVTLALSSCSSSKSPSGAGSSSTTAGSSSSPTSAAGATGSGSQVGLTSGSVTIGQLADVSGPVPGLFAGAEYGLAAWAAYANSQGGVDGRTVKVDFVDSALNCTTYTNGIDGLVNKTFALVGNFSLVDACGEKALKANPDLVDIQGANLNPSLDSVANVYDAEPSTPGDATTVYQWVKNKFGAQAVQKTASLWGSTEQFDYNEQAKAMESIGYKIVYNDGFSPLTTNFTSDILRMKAEGVKVVDETDDAVTDLVAFLQQAAQQNFHPLAVISSTAYDSTFFSTLGNPALAKNVVVYLPTAMYLGQDDSTVPEIKVMAQWLQKVHPGATLNEFVVDGWASGLLFQQAMEKAGSDPTRASLTSALKGITSFTANGLLPTENPGQKKPSVCEVIITIQGNKFVRTDPPTSGFECDGTYVSYPGS